MGKENMRDGIVYYTHHKCREDILLTCRNQLNKTDNLPLVSVSQYPLDFGDNIVLPKGDSDISMFQQQLAGLERINTDIVFFCEHDVLYHPSHFDFTPEPGVYCFNYNVWVLDADDGKTMYYDGNRMVSGLVAHRDILLEHYREKVKWVEQRGKFSRREIGYEPGKPVSRERLGDYPQSFYYSKHPNIDIKHGENITRKRFELSDFNNHEQIKGSWVVSDEIPYWGKIRDIL